MPLPNLPEDFLLDKIPEGIVAEDVRRLMAAVIGGYQERVSDARAAINAVGNAYSPEAAAPSADTDTTVEVVYTGNVGETVRRVLDITADTPDTTDVDALRVWAVAECDIQDDTVVSVTAGSDGLRTVTAQTLDLLAASLGAYLVVNPLLTTAQQAAEKRKQIAAFFPRLKIKGTALSVELVGRAMGFDDVRFAPLWQRAVPTLPSDVGSSVNAADFAREPDVYPSTVLPDPDGVYDPARLDDGPFYDWTGSALSTDSTSPAYFLSVNGQQPWIKLVVSDTLRTRPAPAFYALAGGGPYTKATATLSPELSAVALGAGDAYNGLRIEVSDEIVSTGTATRLRIYDRLSRRKYRSSMFDVAMAVDVDTFIDAYGTTAVRNNPDAFEAASGLPGTYLTTGKPLTGNVSGTWTAAAPGTGELRFDAVQRIGARAMEALEAVRPATRHPRRMSFGFSWTDEFDYAAHSAAERLADNGTVLIGAATTFPTNTWEETLVYDGTLNMSGVTHYTGTHAAKTDVTGHKAEFIYVDVSGTNTLNTETLPDDDVLYVTGSWCTGTYNTSDNSYYLTKTAAFTGTGSVYAQWRATDTEVVRTEPASGAVRLQDRPEDEFDYAYPV